MQQSLCITIRFGLSCVAGNVRGRISAILPSGRSKKGSGVFCHNNRMPAAAPDRTLFLVIVRFRYGRARIERYSLLCEVAVVRRHVLISSASIAFIDEQSVRLYSLSGRWRIDPGLPRRTLVNAGSPSRSRCREDSRPLARLSLDASSRLRKGRHELAEGLIGRHDQAGANCPAGWPCGRLVGMVRPDSRYPVECVGENLAHYLGVP